MLRAAHLSGCETPETQKQARVVTLGEVEAVAFPYCVSLLLLDYSQD